MFITNDRISGYQLFMLMIGGMVGVGIICLPRDAAKATMQDGWVLPLIGGAIVIINTYLLIKLNQAFPKQNFIGYNKEIMGKFIGKLLSFGLLLYFLLLTGITLNIFTYGIQPILLNKTPTEVIYFSILALLLYITRHGLEPIARLNQILTPISLIIFIFFLGAMAFGPIGTRDFLFPTLELIREIELPFLERIISVFLSLWMMTTFATTMIIVYAGAGIGLNNFLNFREPKFLIPFALVPPYFIGLIPQNVGQSCVFQQVVSFFSMFYLLILPPVLFAVYKLKSIFSTGGTSNR